MTFEPHGPVEPRVGLAQARVLVLGLGVTGRACAAVLRREAREVVTAASSDDADLPIPTDAAGVDELLGRIDLILASPGFKPTEPILAAAPGAGVPVWSEAELAWRLRTPRAASPGSPSGAGRGPAPWLAITGTNGKTSTVEMLEAILTAAGLRTRAVGNVGTPLIEAALDPSLDVLAVELSSFQLHSSHTVACQASTVLNLAEDHLDWHGTMEAYGNDKGRIYEHATAACLYNVQDPVTEALVRQAEVAEGCVAVGFTLGAPALGQVGVVDDVLVDRAFHAPADSPERRHHAAELATFADLAHLAPAGGPPPPHVIANALAAAALARAHGVPSSAVRDGLRAFSPASHRIERVRLLRDVAYVDDSKATNAHAAAASLAGFGRERVVWIAGGLAKGARFDDLVDQRGDRLRAAVIIGLDPEPFTTALARFAPQVPVQVIAPGEGGGGVMRRAAAAAQGLARPGDTVLLAPAGASQDQFQNYSARGEAFAAAV
ncbi:MAG: UDP-N-acetylmuramoyl-L-alanine--D-glutamate ligase, partial [Promicromonosporaceae bacterium]|nr:UDP-N-acetylmuramoyl-L-alanine--D-glutamate ligase [Promicromonosporaceae bacterium]